MNVCETCRHWHYTGAMDDDDGTKRGLCRRYPPNIGDAGRFRTYEQGWKYLCEDACATWPVTDLDDWCGEHTPHEPAPAPVTAEKDAEIERLRGHLSNLVEAVDVLIAESEGVYGLHRNGDPAPWEELTAGGQFEAWLLALEDARAALEGEKADG